jgi:tetratricopeptide (TPR) repeat protein
MSQGQPQDKAQGEHEYLAFISYRHADNAEEDRQWATWLHQQLEVYDVPDDLIGTTNLRGEIVPERIYPVFRDEVSLPADADLSHAITQALDKSRFLIVLCSPRAVQSRYVNEEILHFKRSGKQDRIMAALILGEPNASIDPSKTQDPEHANTLECFPPALQYHVTADGELDKTKPTEPIAANFRLPDGGKGITNPNVYKQHLLKKGRNKKDADRLAHLYEEQVNNSRLKIIAGILGVPLERLTQRDKIHQLKKAHAQTRRFRKIAVGMGALALIAITAGSVATVQWRRSEQLLGELRGNLDFMNFELRDVMDKYVPLHERMNTLKRIDAIVDTLQRHGGQAAEEQYQIAGAKILKADQMLKNNKLNPREALALYQEVHSILTIITQRNPGNTQFQRDLSVTHIRIGELQLRLGYTDAALKAYHDSLSIRQSLSQQYPTNTQLKMDLSINYDRIGDLQLRLGKTDAALKVYQDSLAIRKSLTKFDPYNTEFQHALSISHDRVGNVKLRLGMFDAALKAYQDSLATRKTLSQRDSTNSQLKRDLSVSHNEIGHLQLRLGNIDAAMKSFQDSHAIRTFLTKQDPNNTEFQRDLSVSHGNIGDLQLRLGNTDVALKTYQDSLAIAQNLSQHDPGNKQFQHDLWFCYDNIGSLQLHLGNTDAALKAYQDSLMIAQTLTMQDPSNTQLKHDFYVSHDHLGDAYLKLGQLKDTQFHHETGLEMAKALAAKDPDTRVHQTNLAEFYYQMAVVLEKQNLKAKSVEHLKLAIEQVKLLKNKHYDLPDPKDLPPVEHLEAKLKQMEK